MNNVQPPFEGDLHWAWISLVTALLFLWAHHTAFLSDYVLNDDVRQQLYWMQRWLDPEIYPPDLLGDYSRLYVPWGVRFLYFLASHVISPLLFSKILPGILYVCMGTLVYLTGRRVSGWGLGLACVAGYWFMPFFLHAMSGGLARAFAGPLLMLFIYGWLLGSRWIVAAALVLQSLFIPYIFILCGGAAGLGWLGWRFRLLDEPPFLARVSDFVIAACASGLLLGWHVQMGAAGFGPLPWFEDMVGLPEFSDSGRFHIIPVPSLFHELIIRPWESLAPYGEGIDPAGIAWFGILIPFVAVYTLRAPWRLWKDRVGPILCLFLASLLLYVVARVVLLQLFLPSRYLEYSVNIGYCFLLGMCLFSMAMRGDGDRGRILIVMVSLVAILGAYRVFGTGLHDYGGDKALCEYIRAETQQGAVLAGHPTQMDNVLTFGRRNVFASYELAHPWNQGYWSRMKPRLEALFEAYYSSNVTEVARFCQENDIDYVVVDDRFYASEFISKTPFFAPFDEMIRSLSRNVERFALLDPNIPFVKIDDHIRVIDVGALTEYTDAL